MVRGLRGVVVLGLVSLCVVVGVFGVGVGSALAVGSLPLLSEFGKEGVEGGQFHSPRGVAVDNSSDSSKGDVYVADQTNQRVEKFGAAGNFILAFGDAVNQNGSSVCKAGEECQVGTKASGAGQFGNPYGVAVDPTSGSVYVEDFSNHRVQKFSSEGQFELMFGGEVNKVKVERRKEEEEKSEPVTVSKSEEDICQAGEACQAGKTASSGEEGEGKFHAWSAGSFVAVGSAGIVYVGDENRVQEFAPDGAYSTQIKLPAFGKVTALAVNESGDVFVHAFETLSLREFSPAGVELHEFGSSGSVEVESVEAAAVDPVSGDLYVNDENGGDHVVREYEGSAPYALVAEAANGLLASSNGLSLGLHGTLYAADTANTASANKVLILGKPPREGLAGAPSPSIVGSPSVSQDGSRDAQLSVTVNPHFVQGTYYVEYGTDASYKEGDVPAPPGLLMASTVEAPESVVLENLKPETEYHYRFVVTTPSGTAYTPDATFRTDAEGVTGLPDGRVYEQVSPTFKNGNFFVTVTGFMMGLAEAGGDAVVYPMSGAIGSADSGILGEYVSRRTPGVGWTTAQVTPRPAGEINPTDAPSFLLPSSDFTKFLFADEASFAPGDADVFANIFVDELVPGEQGLYGPPTSAEWVTRPGIADPVPAPGVGMGAPVGASQNYVVVGASANLGRVYFSYAGTLLSQDKERAANVGNGLSNGKEARDPWGFYEWEDGVLREAGTLPGGKLNPFGAVPASLGQSIYDLGSRAENFQAGDFDNVVSESGERTFFVSPDPAVSEVSDPLGCKESTGCTSQAPQLYVREVGEDGTEQVSLVSKSMLPSSKDQPSGDGVTAVDNPTYGGQIHGGATFAFASPDGSHVFFASVDRLTEAAPANGALKEYDYDVETGGLTYLPEVEGEIAVVGRHGETMMFVETKESPWATGTGPQELKLWREGPGGGTVKPVVALPDAVEEEPIKKEIVKYLQPRVRSAHVSTSGNVFVFSTNAQIDEPPNREFNDRGLALNKTAENGRGDGTSALQVYRYEVSTEELNCLSCPPKGVLPVGDAYMSYNNYESQVGEEVPHPNGGSSGYAPQTTQEARGMSANGEMVFFDTRSPLVPQATNGKRDVYEWEDGHTYLISSGSASENSYYLDNSESGGDVFFATSAGLVPNDTDGTYDIYDARVPRPGDTVLPEVPPCKGSVCQGPPPVPQLLGAPPSETFSGPGNPPPVAEAKPAVTVKPKAKAKAKKKKKRKQSAKDRRKAHGSSRHGKGRTATSERGQR